MILMIKLNIKPLSVNEAWQGKRYRTQKYKSYQDFVLLLLPKIEIPSGYLEIHLIFGFSSKLADFDNPVKLFVDILQKKYQFNDKMIKRAVIEVEHVEKKKEFIKFEIKQWK